MPQSILQIKAAKKLSKEQESFNKLVKLIEKRTAEIEYLESGLKTFVTKMQAAIGGLSEKKCKVKLQYATMLDRMFEQEKFTKKEKEKLSQIIINLSTISGDEDHGELTNQLLAIFEKHHKLQMKNMSPQEMAMGKMMMKSMLAEFGIDIDIDSMEDFNYKEVQEKILEKMKGDMHGAKTGFEEEANFRRKNKHASGISEKAKAAAEKLNKSWKQIYLSLVKTLHPDTEANEQLKQEKESALKDVTSAYDENNFYKLLQLQIKYSANLGFLENADNAVLKQYIGILKQQSTELGDKLKVIKHEISSQQAHFLFDRNGWDYMEIRIGGERLAIEKDIERLKHEAEVFADVAFLKKEMKKIKMNDLMPPVDFEDDLFF
ncbi:hypothetical protein [Parasediminibacterium sp. JCM 36343]|uniref:hypothetical protein n=1 Tax=Parasediminibacterium sp. JCM 36343 TaxID=3374279 RepID=UPI0039791FE3